MLWTYSQRRRLEWKGKASCDKLRAESQTRRRHVGYTTFTGTKGEGSPPNKAVFHALVKRQPKRLTIIYDCDDAGEIGAQKAASVAASAGLDMSIATLPDDLVLARQEGRKPLEHLAK